MQIVTIVTEASQRFFLFLLLIIASELHSNLGQTRPMPWRFSPDKFLASVARQTRIILYNFHFTSNVSREFINSDPIVVSKLMKLLQLVVEKPFEEQPRSLYRYMYPKLAKPNEDI